MACYRDSFTFCRTRAQKFDIISAGKERHGNMEKEEGNYNKKEAEKRKKM
jgi:hypothetical protein